MSGTSIIAKISMFLSKTNSLDTKVPFLDLVHNKMAKVYLQFMINGTI